MNQKKPSPQELQSASTKLQWAIVYIILIIAIETFVASGVVTFMQELGIPIVAPVSQTIGILKGVLLGNAILMLLAYITGFKPKKKNVVFSDDLKKQVDDTLEDVNKLIFEMEEHKKSIAIKKKQIKYIEKYRTHDSKVCKLIHVQWGIYGGKMYEHFIPFDFVPEGDKSLEHQVIDTANEFFDSMAINTNVDLPKEEQQQQGESNV